MLDIIKSRIEQGYHTIKYPDGPPPNLPAHFQGRPVINNIKCDPSCKACLEACPTGAISAEKGNKDLRLDTGKCVFCRACETACPDNSIKFTREYRLAAGRREDLIVGFGPALVSEAYNDVIKKLFGRSLKLRQVSAGGCNACEADTNVLGTLAWDLGRFGIQFVASPRHADGILITGPVTKNMEEALRQTYEAVSSPKIVIVVGACAISGGVFQGHTEANDGASAIVPVDLFIPGCPPHPLTILDGLLRLLGRAK